MVEGGTLGKQFRRGSPSDIKTRRRAINSTTCLVEMRSARHLTAYVGMFFRPRRIAASKRFGIEHAGPARFDCPGTSRVYTDRNSEGRRVQRNSAAGNWMVGPPSSWSRDQEDSIGQPRSMDRSPVVRVSSRRYDLTSLGPGQKPAW